MRNYTQYCEILGVRPGASASDVKRAFRDRIKRYHPDTATTPEDAERAQLLIEAYDAFKKNGVPVHRVHYENGYRVYTDGTKPAPPEANRPESGRRRPASRAEAAREAGRKLFEELIRSRPDIFGGMGGFGGFGRKSDVEYAAGRATHAGSPLGETVSNLSDLLWGDDEDFAPYGTNVHVREFVPRKQSQHSVPGIFESVLDMAAEYFERAEINLKDVVSRFDRKRNRFRKNWVREYIGELNRVQILYRDVARRYPNYSARSLRRVRQINELISEIRSNRAS